MSLLAALLWLPVIPFQMCVKCTVSVGKRSQTQRHTDSEPRTPPALLVNILRKTPMQRKLSSLCKKAMISSRKATVLKAGCHKSIYTVTNNKFRVRTTSLFLFFYRYGRWLPKGLWLLSITFTFVNVDAANEILDAIIFTIRRNKNLLY